MFEGILERLALALDREAIPYMLIGGQAVLLYGEPRLTRDIDIALGLDLDGLDRVLAAAGEAGLTPLADPETFTRSTMVLPCAHADSDIRVDFIFSSHPYEVEAIGRARTVVMGNARVRFAALEDLIVHKVLVGRARDMEDVKAVLIKNRQADLDYVRRWLLFFKKALNEPFVERFNLILMEIGEVV